MRINQNIAALNTYRQLSANNVSTGKSLEKLSSGLRINRAGDDAAGLAISEKMRAQVRGLDQASRNSQDAISLIQTAEGALNETQSILQRMRELAVQASNDTNVAVDRSEIQKEINQLTSEINRIGNTTEFNTMKLLNGDRLNDYALTTTVTTVGVNDKGEALTATLSDVTFADSGKPTFSGNAITASAESGGFFGMNGTVSGSGVVIGIYRSGNEVVVSGWAEGVSGSSNDISGYWRLSADASGKYTFDQNGISFSITDISSWAESGAAGVVTYTMNSGVSGLSDTSISTNQNVWSDWSGTSGIARGNTVISGSNAINLASGLAEGTYSINFELAADGTSGAITISRTSGDNAASGIIARYSGITDFSGVFDQDGINFAFSLSGLGSGGSGTLSFTVTHEVETTTSGGADRSLTFQIGANKNQSMSLSVSDMRSKALGVSASGAGGDFVATTNVTDGTNSTETEYALDVSTASKASNAITIINQAIEDVSAERSKLGAVQNRLEHTINNLGTSSENLTAAESRIRDVDMARQMMEFTKNNILTQAAQSMLAQANQQPQGVLQLLR